MDYRKHPKVEPAFTGIVRADGLVIPADPENTDWQAYQVWLKAGNVPGEAAVPVPESPDIPRAGAA